MRTNGLQIVSTRGGFEPTLLLALVYFILASISVNY